MGFKSTNITSADLSRHGYDEDAQVAPKANVRYTEAGDRVCPDLTYKSVRMDEYHTLRTSNL